MLLGHGLGYGQAVLSAAFAALSQHFGALSRVYQRTTGTADTLGSYTSMILIKPCVQTSFSAVSLLDTMRAPRPIYGLSEH